jgi:hypothetical protein
MPIVLSVQCIVENFHLLKVQFKIRKNSVCLTVPVDSQPILEKYRILHSVQLACSSEKQIYQSESKCAHVTWILMILKYDILYLDPDMELRYGEARLHC